MDPSRLVLPPHVRQNYPSFWPNDTSVPERWRGVQKRVPYPFLNYGGWVGTAGRAALVMKTIADMLQCTPVPQPKPEEGKDPPIPACPWHDQHAAQLVLVSDVCRSPGDEGAKCALDNFGEVFYSGFPMCGGLKPRIDGDWWNADAGVTPLTVHLNGMAKGGCAKAGFIERMTSKRTAWFHRVNVSAQAPVLQAQEHVQAATAGLLELEAAILNLNDTRSIVAFVQADRLASRLTAACTSAFDALDRVATQAQAGPSRTLADRLHAAASGLQAPHLEPLHRLQTTSAGLRRKLEGIFSARPQTQPGSGDGGGGAGFGSAAPSVLEASRRNAVLAALQEAGILEAGGIAQLQGVREMLSDLEAVVKGEHPPVRAAAAEAGAGAGAGAGPSGSRPVGGLARLEEGKEDGDEDEGEAESTERGESDGEMQEADQPGGGGTGGAAGAGARQRADGGTDAPPAKRQRTAPAGANGAEGPAQPPLFLQSLLRTPPMTTTGGGSASATPAGSGGGWMSRWVAGGLSSVLSRLPFGAAAAAAASGPRQAAGALAPADAPRDPSPAAAAAAAAASSGPTAAAAAAEEAAAAAGPSTAAAAAAALPPACLLPLDEADVAYAKLLQPVLRSAEQVLARGRRRHIAAGLLRTSSSTAAAAAAATGAAGGSGAAAGVAAAVPGSQGSEGGAPLDSARAAGTALGGGQAVPGAFVCPIAFAVMRDPVILLDSGHTFERASIESHLASKRTNPITNLPLSSAGVTLVPNAGLRAAVEAWLRRHTLSFEDADALPTSHALSAAGTQEAAGGDAAAMEGRDTRQRMARSAEEEAFVALFSGLRKRFGAALSTGLTGIVVGSRVRIRAVTVDEAKAVQETHGGWGGVNMGAQLGKIGVVTVVYADGDVKLLVDGSTHTYRWAATLVDALDDPGSGSGGAGGSSAGAPAIRAGDRVRIRSVPVHEAEAAQGGHGGWSSTMRRCLGREGMVSGVDSDGDISVEMRIPARRRGGSDEGTSSSSDSDSDEEAEEREVSYLWNAELVELVEAGAAQPAVRFAAGARVRIRAVPQEEAEAAQAGHGGWQPHMAAQLGRSGKVQRVERDGGLHVKMDAGGGAGVDVCWNPALVEAVEARPEAAFVEGVKVRIRRVPLAEAVDVMTGHCGWNSAMESELGKEGVITEVVKASPGDLRLRVRTGTGSWVWHSELLELLHALPPGEARALEALDAPGLAERLSAALASGLNPNVCAADGSTALMAASAAGQVALIGSLLSVGAAKDAADKDGRTALHYAASAEVVEALLGARAQIAAMDKDGLTAAHSVLQRGCAEAALALIRAGGAGPDAACKGGYTLLHRACEAGATEVARLLLESAARTDKVTETTRHTPLFLAAKGGHASVIELLLSAGADPEAGDLKAAETPLYAACEAGHAEAAKVLIARGANKEAASTAGLTPLLAAVQAGAKAKSRERFIAVIEMLADHGANMNAVTKDDRTAVAMVLAAATTAKPPAASPAADLLEALLKRGASPDGVTEAGELKAPSPLYIAVTSKWPEVVRLLLAAKPDTEACTSNKWRPLHSAAREGHAGIVKMLLDAGAEIDGLNKDKATALYIAVQEKKLDVAGLLLERGCDPNLPLHPAMWTPLAKAAKVGSAELVRLILNKGGSRVDRSLATKDGWTVLHIAAFDGHIDVLRAVLAPSSADAPGQRGPAVDVNARTKDGATALLSAVQQGKLDCVRLLIEAGADVNQGMNSTTLPLTMAARKGWEDILSLLLASGASLASSNTALSTAITFKHFGIACILLEAEVTLPESGKASARSLMEAAVEGGHARLARLVAARASPGGANLRLKGGSVTALELAVAGGRAEVVTALCEAGADKAVRSADGKPLLVVACERRDVATVKALLEAGCSATDCCAQTGFAPLHVAVAEGSQELVEALLGAAGADVDLRTQEPSVPLAEGTRVRLQLASALVDPTDSEDAFEMRSDDGGEPEYAAEDLNLPEGMVEEPGREGTVVSDTCGTDNPRRPVMVKMNGWPQPFGISRRMLVVLGPVAAPAAVTSTAGPSTSTGLGAATPSAPQDKLTVALGEGVRVRIRRVPEPEFTRLMDRVIFSSSIPPLLPLMGAAARVSSRAAGPAWRVELEDGRSQCFHEELLEPAEGAVGVGSRVRIRQVPEADFTRLMDTVLPAFCIPPLLARMGHSGRVASRASGPAWHIDLDDGGSQCFHEDLVETLPGPDAAADVAAAGPPLTVGAHVHIRALPLEEAQRLSGGLTITGGMQGQLGRRGVVLQVLPTGSVMVQVEGSRAFIWHPALLELAEGAGAGADAALAAAAPVAAPAAAATIGVGARVRIRPMSVAEAERLAGPSLAINTHMRTQLGKLGEVVEVTASGPYFRVRVDGDSSSQTFSWRREHLELVSPAAAAGAGAAPAPAAAAVPPPPIQQGSRVRVKSVSVAQAQAVQTGAHGGWGAAMAGFLGKTGKVTEVYSNGDFRVKSDEGNSYRWHPSLLEPAELRPASAFKPGLRVRIRALSLSEAKAAMDGHGGWGGGMTGELGQERVINCVCHDRPGDLRVRVFTADKRDSWIWNSELLELLDSDVSGDAARGVQAPAADRPLTPGTRVRIRSVSVAEAEAAQKGHGGWGGAGMAAQLGRPGVVVRVDAQGDMHVRLDGEEKEYCWAPALVERLVRLPHFVSGSTALSLASAACHGALVALLLRRGAAPGLADALGWAPLHHAACACAPEALLRALLEAGADKDQRTQDGEAPLDIALRGDHMGVAEVLLQAGAQLGESGTSPGSAKSGSSSSLRSAVAAGKAELVELLLRAGLSPNEAAEEDGRTPLHVAAERGLDDIARRLLCGGGRGGAADPNARDAKALTPLHLAASGGHVAVLDLLLVAGADRAAAGGEGGPWTPLALAVSKGHVACVRSLLIGGAGPALTTRTAGGVLPLHLAAKAERSSAKEAEKQAEIVGLLLRAGADPEARTGEEEAAEDESWVKASRTALWLAAEAGCLPSVRALLAAGACVDATGELGATPLFVACEEGHVDVVRELLEAKANLNAALTVSTDSAAGSRGGWTPLVAALSVGEDGGDEAKAMELMELLVDKGADTSITVTDGRCLLAVAAAAGRKDLVKCLLSKHKCSPNNKPGAPGGKPVPTALGEAARRGWGDVVHMLLEAGAEVDAAGEAGCTALHSAVKRGSTDIIKALLGKSPNLELRDDLGRTPLHVAAEEGETGALEMLLDKGAAKEAKSEVGETALQAALRCSRWGAARALLRAGARAQEAGRDKAGDPPLVAALNRGADTDMVGALIAAGADVGSTGAGGLAPLQLAAKQGKPALIRTLLAAGAPPSPADPDGRTPLHLAAAKDGAEDAVKALLEAGADVNARAKDGATPLLEAARAGLLDTTTVLLEAGADADLAGPNGEAPAHVAAKRGALDVLSMLLLMTPNAHSLSSEDGSSALLLASGAGHHECVTALLSAGAAVDKECGAQRRTALLAAAAGGHTSCVRKLLAAGASAIATDADGKTPLDLASAGAREVRTLLEAARAEQEARRGAAASASGGAAGSGSGVGSKRTRNGRK
ncbi:hypothetical protein HYH03_016251 [Edaphochlamys debaryana]|uniref:RING-type E3 ubiquitin transferase n=1 Tax=Edaphochlamys debaryana TaxID=47281 RepID=A0A835XIZ2_9CHLO|nr:hypothetical protein HYH03_016251 [Edaphochlamys debaryana]|eukprot:KAG2484953.1 hypothetical protein HYH03_016251 [Edaphochlamys debaryana]